MAAASDKPVITFKFTPERLARGFTLRIEPAKGPGPFEYGCVTPAIFNRRLEVAGIKDTIILQAAKAPKSAKAKVRR